MHTNKNKPDYSSLFYFNPLPSWVYDMETFKVLDVNQAAMDHYQYSKDEFLGLTLKDLRPKNEIPKLIAAHLDIKAHQGNIYFGVFTHQIKSGGLIRMKINGHKVDYLGNECMMAVGQDITEEEGQVRLLQESEERLKAASAIARLGYWRLDLETNTLSWTDEVFNIWGRDKNQFEVNYENFLKTIHPDDQKAFEKEQNAGLAGEKDPDNIHRIILPDTSIRWVHELGRLVRDGQGEVIAFEGTVQDITARKDEEQRLKLLESVITHANDAIMITEAEPFEEPGPRIIYVNKAFTKMTGYTSEEVIGQTPRILQGPNSDKEELAKLGKAIRNWESYEMTTINYKKNGEEYWVNFSVSPVADEKGWHTHWIAVERDVTEQKNKEREKELLGKISLNFSIDNDLNTSVIALCETISEFSLFDFVELWLPNLEKTQIQLVAHKSTTSQADIFYTRSKDVKSFDLAEGLPGIVWQKKRAILWKEISKNDDFIRKEAAEKAGLETVLGIPLFFDNKVVGVLVIGTQRDITYLKKYLRIFEQFEEFIGAEISRKKLENDLSHLYDAIPDIICITDLKGRFLKINKSGCEMLGYSEEEILYHTFEKFVHPEDKKSSKDDLIKLNKGGKTYGFENRYINKKGEIIWLSWTSNSNLQENLIYATARNITAEKKLSELNLQSSQLARIGSWEVDLIGNKMFWSDMVHELHQTNPEKFVPEMGEVINFYREDFRPFVETEVNKCIQTGVPFDFEAILITSQKNERWVRAIGNSEMIHGKCQRVFGSFQDIHTQKLNEIALQKSLKSLEDYKFSLDQSALIAITDEKGVITYVNDNFCKISQYSKEELIGNTHQLINSKHHSKPFFSDLWRNIASGKVWHGEIKNKAKDGSNYWVDTTIVPFLDEKNKPFQYLAIRIDITARKFADEKVVQTLEEKNNILESIGDAFFSVNKDWVVTYWNKEAKKILGKKRDEIIGKNLWEVYPEAIDSDFYRQNHKALETQEIVTFEEHYLKLNIWFEVTVYPSNVGLSVYFKDVTLRKEADIRLTKANERFQMATLATNDAIWDWDLINKTFFRSNGIGKFFGRRSSRSLVENDFWKDKFHPEDLDNIKKSIQQAIADPLCTRWETEYRIYNDLGEIVNVVDRGVIIRDEEGKATRMVGAMTDITAQKNYENQLLGLNKSIKKNAYDLELKNQELEQFAYIASHDLQEPLRMISSFMDLLKRKYGAHLDDKAHMYIDFATDGAKRMKKIILDLLDYSKAGKSFEVKEKVDLNELQVEYLQLRRKIIAEKSAMITYNNLPQLYTCRAAMTQIFHCLLDNAIKYSKISTPPNIHIAAIENEKEWEFSIKDNGIGIDPKFFDKIFIIFQRLHNNDQFSGTGIGLSIAKKQIKFLGGKIWVESKPDQGSVFYFTVPKK